MPPSLRLLAMILPIILLTILIPMAECINIADTKISSTRNSNRANICGYYSGIFTAEQRQKSKQKVQQYTHMTDTQTQALLFDNKFAYGSALNVVITLPHLISFAVLLALITPLFCCCVWPEKYPVCKTWRKDEKEMYSKCQLKWPAYFSLVLYLIITVGGLIALIQAPAIVKKYNDVGCKKAALFDDLLYGRVSTTSPSRFYVGLQPLRNELNIFNASKLATFFSDSSSSLSTANQVRTKQNLVQTTIQTNYGGYINSIYSNAFTREGSTYYDVTSAFKTMYWGPTNDTTKMLGIVKQRLSTIFGQINSALDDMVSAWQTLSATTQPAVRTQINDFSNSILDLKAKLEVYLDQVGTAFYNNTLYDQLHAILSVFYGMIFGFAILGLVGSILITFCTVIRTRLIMYFTCGFLTVFGLVGFIFLIFLGFVHPQASQVCAYADKRLTSGTQTKLLLQNMGYPDFADKIVACMQDGTGKMIDTMNPSFSTSFDMINTIAQGTLKFNDKIPTFTAAKIQEPFTTIASTLTKVKNSEVWDIDDTTAITHVNKVVNKNYTLGVTCNSINVNGDAWMPSFSLYTCPAGKSKMGACPDLSVQTTCPLGCYQILNEFTSPSGDHSYTSSLAIRYNSNTCNYYQYIINLHNNWNVIRQNKMDTVNTTIASLKTIVDDYAVKANSVKAGLNSFKTTLEANLNSMTNLTSGSFNGMDCRAIGESIWDLRDAFCIGLVDSINYNIICLSIICYGVLLLACFVTCTGVRHFKHLQKMQMHVGYKGTPISLSDTRILDK